MKGLLKLVSCIQIQLSVCVKDCLACWAIPIVPPSTMHSWLTFQKIMTVTEKSLRHFKMFLRQSFMNVKIP